MCLYGKAFAMTMAVQVSAEKTNGMQGTLRSDCISTTFNETWYCRERLDSLNDEYGQYYKHAIETDFAGDDGKWKVVQAMVQLRSVQHALRNFS